MLTLGRRKKVVLNCMNSGQPTLGSFSYDEPVVSNSSAATGYSPTYNGPLDATAAFPIKSETSPAELALDYTEFLRTPTNVGMGHRRRAPKVSVL